MKTLFSLFLLSTTLVFGQTTPPLAFPDSTKNALVKLKDGTALNGKIVSQSGNEIVIKTKNLGNIRTPLANVESVTEVREYEKKGTFWFDNPHSSRYFFAPSAYNLKKGEGYYQNAYLFVNSANYGVTDNFSMGAGFVFNPSFRDWQLLFFTPKVSFSVSDNVRVGGGAIVVTAFSREYTFDTLTYIQTGTNTKLNTLGIFYANGSFGSEENNLSVGVGWGFGNGRVSSSPVLNIGGMARVGKNFSLVTENWIAPNIVDNNGLGLYSGGVRIFGERMSVDLALAIPAATGLNGFIAIPYVDFVYKFGRKNK